MSGVCAGVCPREQQQSHKRSRGKTASYAASPPIGAPGLEPGTSSPPDWRANQAAPRPVPSNHTARTSGSTRFQV
jgi:hypothetical protein